MKNKWNNVECICTEQELIKYTPHHIYIYTLYLHYLYYLFFTLAIVIYSLYYLYFLLYLLRSMFSNVFCSVFFCFCFFCNVFIQYVSLFVDKRVSVVSLLHDFLLPQVSGWWHGKRLCAHEIEVCAYNNDNDNNFFDKNNNDKSYD